MTGKQKATHADDGRGPRKPSRGAARKPTTRRDVGDDRESTPLWFVNHLAGRRPLPADLQAVVKDILEPLYATLVLQEKDPLLRTVGNSILVMQTVEVLGQPEVIEAARRAADDPHEAAPFAAVLNRYLRIAQERARALNLHLQLRRAKHAKWQVPADPLGILNVHGRGI
jgi:hypothetical protein